MNEILKKVQQFADEIKDSSQFIRLSEINDELKKNYQKLLDDFASARDAFDQIMSNGGKHHPEFKKVAKKFMNAKHELFCLPIVCEYLLIEKQHETTINDLMNEISQLISTNINPVTQIGVLRKKGKCNEGK